MTKPTIGFVGMTHLGLVSGVSAAEKGFKVVCFDADPDSIKALDDGNLPVSEPKLSELYIKNRKKISFSASSSDLLACDIVYIAPDIPTDDAGKSDLGGINHLLDLVYDASRIDAVIVVLSQVPPGFSRKKSRSDRIYFYQVETLIFGCAVDRALHPERYILGCSEPEKALPRAYEEFLNAYNCAILKMRFESAELAKISINMCLVSSISTANTIAELCEKIGANWSEIVPALKLDKRIGPYSYQTPGLGIAGGNLERDLKTFCDFADEFGTDASVVRSWVANSRYRRDWPLRVLHEEVLTRSPQAVIGVWGLAYKQNTHSIKNSPAIALINAIPDCYLRLFDPVVSADVFCNQNVVAAVSELDACSGVDVLIIMTPWPQFSTIRPRMIAKCMRGNTILDPFKVLSADECRDEGLNYLTLGVSY